ncbi:CdaR family protein [Gillisia sp. Q332]|uniref:CdaR family protein n=1 Tax=Gillisia xinjiangensis TaxID=3384765 RepID=UPI00391CFD1C
MMQDKTKQRKPLIKKGPLKTFLFFLAFSAFVWIFVQFSKQYSEVVGFPITYINVPKDKIILGDSPNSLELRLRDNGINIAFRKIFPKKLAIDISETTEDGNKLIYDLEKQKQAILTQLKIDYEDVNFLQEDLKINFEQRMVKKLPIVPDIELSFSVGYSALEGIKLEPDSVTISGPKNILDTLQKVQTRSLRINNISKDVQGSIKLNTANLKRLTFYREEVNYSLRTDKFTEGKAVIPVELVNVPENLNVVIFPKEVTVFYQVSLQKYDKINPSGFKVVADFQKASNSDGYLLAQIVKKPQLVNNVRLNEQKIQFIIKR